MYPNESNGELNGSGETGSHNFRIDFTTNYSPSGSNNFQIVVPVTGVAASGNNPFGTLTFGAASQTFNLTAQPGYTLTGRIMWDGADGGSSAPHTNSSSGHLPSNPGDLATQFVWTANDHGTSNSNVGYMYLELTYGYDTAEVPEPATFVLLGSALLGLGLLDRRRRKA